jgi:uncharacterized membrane protein HdeD (DUF308 family)
MAPLESVGSILSRKESDHWWSAVLRGLAGIAPGVLALVQPQIGPLRLLYVMAARTLVTGILDILAAIRLWKEIKGEWLLIPSVARAAAMPSTSPCTGSPSLRRFFLSYSV